MDKNEYRQWLITWVMNRGRLRLFKPSSAIGPNVPDWFAGYHFNHEKHHEPANLGANKWTLKVVFVTIWLPYRQYRMGYLPTTRGAGLATGLMNALPAWGRWASPVRPGDGRTFWAVDHFTAAVSNHRYWMISNIPFVMVSPVNWIASPNLMDWP